ncbi:MAG: hypothetical protein ACKOZT_09995 [Cyanobium sp.]
MADSASAHPGAAAPSQEHTMAALLERLDAISRSRPDRVLRLRGVLPGGEAGASGSGEAAEARNEAGGEAAAPDDPFELLIFRGFSSSTTHPTGFDPDQPALPEEALIEAAELLQGPLHPSEVVVLAGPLPVTGFLDPGAWS